MRTLLSFLVLSTALPLFAAELSSGTYRPLDEKRLKLYRSQAAIAPRLHHPGVLFVLKDKVPSILIRDRKKVFIWEPPSKEYEGWRWVYVGQIKKTGTLYAILENPSDRRIRLVQSLDYGSGWDVIGEMQKPNPNARLKAFTMDKKGNGMLSFMEPTSKTTGQSDLYIFVSRDFGKNWQRRLQYVSDLIPQSVGRPVSVNKFIKDWSSSLH